MTTTYRSAPVKELARMIRNTETRVQVAQRHPLHLRAATLAAISIPPTFLLRCIERTRRALGVAVLGLMCVFPATAGQVPLAWAASPDPTVSLYFLSYS